MKPMNWSTEKNIRLKAERDVSFEEVLSAMSHAMILSDILLQSKACVTDRQYGATDVRRNGAISKCLKWGLERC